jgi:hypothetical protein
MYTNLEYTYSRNAILEQLTKLLKEAISFDMYVLSSVCLSVCLSFSLSICLSVCLSVYLSVFLSVLQFVFLAVSPDGTARLQLDRYS